ncbi:MAG: long-chain fatty acid--CoA ligase [Myxococcota bacterium]
MRPAADPARTELDRRVLDWMREPDWSEDDARFEELALALFAFQFERCPPYARFCQGRGVEPGSLCHWREIPAVPTGAFKEVGLRSFPVERTVRTFRTSGTSRESQARDRGELHLDTLALYEASLLPAFERGVLPDRKPDEPIRLRFLAPAPAEAPDSSLSHMFGCVLAAWGDARSGFDVRGGVLRTEELFQELEHARAEGIAVTLCGTAFGFVHLLDALEEEGRCLPLPDGSRAMETGGFKGRSRKLSLSELHAGIEARLGIPAARIVNQYGMTELGSQFYDSVLGEPGGIRRKRRPPWTRVRLLDPSTGREAAADRAGRIAVLDLANTGSVLAVQTADLGRSLADGFEVLGREPGAEARGCSLAADLMLADAAE